MKELRIQDIKQFEKLREAELNLAQRNIDEIKGIASKYKEQEIIKTYQIPDGLQGVVFAIGAERGAVKLTINGSEYMLTPEGAKDLGKSLMDFAAKLRGDKPARRRHK
jgi:hypothetical protein